MKRVTLILIAAWLAASQAVIAAAPPEATISLGQRSLEWAGGPLLGAAADAATCAGGCDEFALTIDVPPAYWAEAPAGVVVRIEWPDSNDELDLHVLDPDGNEVATSIELHTNVEQALIHAPTPGTYRVQVVALHALNVTYRGRAWIGRVTDRAAATAPVSMRFAPPAFVDPQLWVAMPSIWAGHDGPMYVAGAWSLPQLSGPVWRSMDGGRTFRLMASSLAPGVVDPRMRACVDAVGGGDSDVITDRTGRVYFDDLWAANVTVGTSTDRGEQWHCNQAAATSPELDRPWLAPAPSADGDGPNVDAYLAYRDLAVGGLAPYAGEVVKPIQEHLDFTRNGGVTWEQGTTYARDAIGYTGPLFTARDGTIYQVYQYSSSVWLARSSDEGKTMQSFRVSDRFGVPANQWLGGDVDEAGNVYAAWVDQGTWDVMYSASTDRGEHWSTPFRVNPPSSETAAMPWVAAGKGGDVAIAWYGTDSVTSPDDAPAETRWYAWVARSANAVSAVPRFERTTISETPVRLGPLCVKGIGCGDRKMGDFFEIDIAPDGAVVGSFADTGRIQKTNDGYSPGPYVMVARQMSGLGMGRSVAVAVEPAGDASPPDPTEEVAALDILGLPRSEVSGNAVRVSFRLSSTADLTEALQATNAGVATDAYWLVLWKANDRVEYAGLHVDREGNRSFFGGDEPVSIGRPDATVPGFVDKMASYPPTFTLEGSVDEASGVVAIDVPLEPYHLSAGDVLHSMQVFSMTALAGGQTFLQPLLVVDGTPAQSLRIASALPTLTLPNRAARPGALPATGLAGPPVGVAVALLLGAWMSRRASRRLR